MGKQQHVVKREEGWAVLGAGNKRDTARVETQKEALAIARKIAIKEKSEVVTHDVKGRIRDKDSYGKDPNPPRDKRY